MGNSKEYKLWTVGWFCVQCLERLLLSLLW